MVEQWKSIPLYIGLYSVSNKGRIWIHEYRRSDGRLYPSKIMKPFVNSGGYLLVALWKNKKRKRFLIHRLVGVCFVKGGHIGDTINHKNGQRHDNRAENLEWCSMSYNVKDGFNRGRVIWNKGRKGRQRNHNTIGLRHGSISRKKDY